MAVANDINPTDILAVGEKPALSKGSTAALYQPRPIAHTQAVGGHYRYGQRQGIGLTAGMAAAGTRLFEVRNSSSTNLLIVERLTMLVAQVALASATQEMSFDVYRLTSFSAVDTVNATTINGSFMSPKRTGMLAASSGFVVRVTDGVAGMTGGTLTKDTSPIVKMPVWCSAASTTTDATGLWRNDTFDDGFGAHPLVLGQDEGFVIEIGQAGPATPSARLYFDIALAVTTAY